MIAAKTPVATQTPDNRRRRRSLFHRQEGQSALEFALLLPVFILFLLLLVDLGIMSYEYISISTAVREGARYGAVNCGDGSCTEAEIEIRTIERSGGILNSTTGPAEVSVGWVDNDEPLDGTISGRGDSVVVQVDHPYSFLFFPGSVNVHSCADMRLEQTDITTGLTDGTGC